MNDLARVLAPAAALLLLCSCGGGGGSENAVQSQVESSAYLTEEGKLFVVPIVDGIASSPQLAASGLSTGVATANARKVFSGTFDTTSGTIKRARYTELVYVAGTKLGKLDLSTAAPTAVTTETGDDLCIIEGVAVDLQSHADSVVDIYDTGTDHDCATRGDAGRYLQHLNDTSPGTVVPATTGYAPPGARNTSGALTASLGATISGDSLTLERLDDATFERTTLLTASGAAGGRRLTRSMSAGTNRVVLGFTFPAGNNDDYYLFDETTGTVRLAHRVEQAARTPTEQPRLTNRAIFVDDRLLIADKSAVVAVDPAPNPVATHNVIDFGSGKVVDRIADAGGDIVAVLVNADQTFTVSRFAAAGGAPTEITTLPTGSYAVVEAPGDVVLLNFTATSGARSALAYDGGSHELTTFENSQWIGGTSATTSGGSLVNRLISKVGDTGLKVETFGQAYLLATRNGQESNLRLVRRDAIATPVDLRTTPVVSTGRMDDLGQRVLVELRTPRSDGSIDGDIYLLDIGAATLVPIATQPGFEEYLMDSQIY